MNDPTKSPKKAMNTMACVQQKKLFLWTAPLSDATHSPYTPSATLGLPCPYPYPARVTGDPISAAAFANAMPLFAGAAVPDPSRCVAVVAVEVANAMPETPLVALGGAANACRGPVSPAPRA